MYISISLQALVILERLMPELGAVLCFRSLEPTFCQFMSTDCSSDFITQVFFSERNLLERARLFNPNM
jgi:hypothetical protein